jgi:hypothetical protein
MALLQLSRRICQMEHQPKPEFTEHNVLFSTTKLHV